MPEKIHLSDNSSNINKPCIQSNATCSSRDMHAHLCETPRPFGKTVLGKEGKDSAYNRRKNLLKNIHHSNFELVDKLINQLYELHKIFGLPQPEPHFQNLTRFSNSYLSTAKMKIHRKETNVTEYIKPKSLLTSTQIFLLCPVIPRLF